MQSPTHGSGMTIHRSRQGHRYRTGSHTNRSSGGNVSDAGAILTIVQIVVCIIMLVTIFTMQFLDAERYNRTGELYRAVMSGEGEAMYVGAFGTPITKELIEGYAKELTEPVEVIVQEQEEQASSGQGGETPYLPENLYLGRVVLSAKPVYPAYGVITSPFGVRSHPISKKTDFHTGIDIAAGMGDSIYAVLPGKVAEVGSSRIYGNFIRIIHSAGLESVYNHCSEILAKEGAVVRSGERVALVGSTGVSTGPHLHFDLLTNGRYTDPMQVFK